MWLQHLTSEMVCNIAWIEKHWHVINYMTVETLFSGSLERRASRLANTRSKEYKVCPRNKIPKKVRCTVYIIKFMKKYLKWLSRYKVYVFDSLHYWTTAFRRPHFAASQFDQTPFQSQSASLVPSSQSSMNYTGFANRLHRSTQTWANHTFYTLSLQLLADPSSCLGFLAFGRSQWLWSRRRLHAELIHGSESPSAIIRRRCLQTIPQPIHRCQETISY